MNALKEEHTIVPLSALNNLALQGEVSSETRNKSHEALRTLLMQADLDSPETLYRLSQELISLGYGDQEFIHPQPTLEEPKWISPLVQGQIPGKGWAFIWAADDNYENMAWLIGSRIRVGQQTYLVQSIEGCSHPVDKGDKMTLLCSPLGL